MSRPLLALVACLVVGIGFIGSGVAFEAADTYPIWVGATVLVEILALALALQVRKQFEPGDAGRTTWTLIVGFLSVRILAEVRLLSFDFDFVPQFISASAELTNFYTVWLRYLYTVADLLMVGALVNTLRSYRSLGLEFELRAREWAGICVVASMPLIVVLLRDQVHAEVSLTIYRIVAASVGAGIAAMSLAVLRFVRQMGGGQLARVWGAIGVAGLARALSFVALALLSAVSPIAGDLGEQAMLWLFASAWLVGVMLQHEMLAR